MHIANFKKLAENFLRKKLHSRTSSLRGKALLIAEAGLEAIDIVKIINQRIKLKNNKLSIYKSGVVMHHNTAKPLVIDLNNYQKIFLIGVGKGSALASATLAKILRKRLTAGIALDVQYRDIRCPKIDENNIRTSDVQKLKIFIGSHPLPSRQNIKATEEIIKLAKNLKKNDLLITLICGGGSALLCGSRKELKASQTVFIKLTEAGANISELNIVRKHLSGVKGGGLAKAAYPATAVSLIVSDVPTADNDLSAVASGPTVFDKTTKKDAIKVIKKYQHKSARLSALISALKETPKDKKYFKKVKNVLFLSNREPILAMEQRAKELGFKPKIYSLKLKGEAKNALLPLIKSAEKDEVVFAGGETTVTLRKNKELGIMNYELGKGGRNMESVLGTLNSLHNSSFILHNSVIVSFASDGRDNTEAAGAIADASTLKKAGKLKINPKNFLDNHDSFRFFEKTGDLMYIEQKCFNVADLMVVLREE